MSKLLPLTRPGNVIYSEGEDFV